MFVNILFTLFLGLLLLLVFHVLYMRSRKAQLINRLPGNRAWPIIGNLLDYNVSREALFKTSVEYANKYRPIYRAWFCTIPVVIICSPEYVEVLLNSTAHIKKSNIYDFLHSWLGTGLVTSFGSKWRSRRKLLTPAFHFTILERYLPVFHKYSQKLVAVLEEPADTDVIDIYPFLSRCMLDIISASAMGYEMKSLEDEDSEYFKSVHDMLETVIRRQLSPWLFPNPMFRLTNLSRKQDKAVKVLNSLCKKVIHQRKEKREKAKTDSASMDVEEDMGIKRRTDLLDLLLEASERNPELTDDGILEEVNTFMFAGHDTTTSATTWTLFLLGTHPDIQERVYEEICEMPEEITSLNEVHNLRYLERCIKEAIRMYPSVPILGRQLEEDLLLRDYLIPAHTTIMIAPYVVHRDPNHWSDPEVYDPDRFLPERIVGRRPYAYIPFSGGPRNCIGQKFAMCEMKIVLSSLLRKFRVQTLDTKETVTLLGEVVLKPLNGLKVRLMKRK